MNTNATDPARAQAWAKLEREWAIGGMPADKIRLARAAFDAGAALAQQPEVEGGPSAAVGLLQYDREAIARMLEESIADTNLHPPRITYKTHIVQRQIDLLRRANHQQPEAPAQEAGGGEVQRMDAITEAYNRWPADIRKKLSLHDLRRMSGWTPPTPHPASPEGMISLKWLEENHTAWIRSPCDTPYLEWLHNALLAQPSREGV